MYTAGVYTLVRFYICGNFPQFGEEPIVATCHNSSEGGNMTNNGNVLTVRVSESSISKLDALMEMKNKELERFDMKPIGRKEIVEDAIKELYYKTINKTRDPDIWERIHGMVHDEVDSSMNNFHRKINRILFLAIKNDYGNKIFYRSPSVLPSPKDRQEAIDIIVNEPSRWNDALEEYMNRNWQDEEQGKEGGDEG